MRTLVIKGLVETMLMEIESFSNLVQPSMDLSGLTLNPGTHSISP